MIVKNRYTLITNKSIGFHPQPEVWGLPAEELKSNRHGLMKTVWIGQELASTRSAISINLSFYINGVYSSPVQHMVLAKDNRSKKVAVVAHCLINQNAKVNGFAFYSSMIKPIVDMLHSKDFGIIQLPCPETLYAGTRRWWYVREQYDTPGYHSHCRRILQPIVDQIAEYKKEGYKVVVIGLDGSPSCGVAASGSSSSWGGAPKIPEEEYGSYPTTDKPGIFIEELLKMLGEAKVEVPPMIGAGFDMPNFEMAAIESEIEAFLDRV